MKTTIDNSEIPSKHPKPSAAARILRASAAVIGSIIILIAIILTGATMYLTPERVTRLINEEGSRYLCADINVSNASLTIWRTFPYARLHADSLRIDSKALDNIPSAIKSQLPSNAKFLASTGEISAEINVIKALRNDFTLRDVRVSSPTLNLVSVNDSTANYLILPRHIKVKKPSHVALSTLEIGAPAIICFNDIATGSAVMADISEALAEVTGDDTYRFNLTTHISGHTSTIASKIPMPMHAEGSVRIIQKPLCLEIADAAITAAGITTRLAASLTPGTSGRLDRLDIDLSSNNLANLLNYISITDLPEISAKVPVSLQATLLHPYPFPSSEATPTSGPLPSFLASVYIPSASVVCGIGGDRPLQIDSVSLRANAVIDRSNPSKSHIAVSSLNAFADHTDVHLKGEISRLLSDAPIANVSLLYDTDLTRLAPQIVPSSTLALEGRIKGAVSVAGKVSPMGITGRDSLQAKASFHSDHLSVKSIPTKLSAMLGNLTLNISSLWKGNAIDKAAFSSIDNLLQAKVDIRTGNLSVNDTGNGIALTLGGLAVKGDMPNPRKASGNVSLLASDMKVKAKTAEAHANGITLSLKGGLRTMPVQQTDYYNAIPVSEEDSIISNRTNHTSLYLSSPQGSMLASMLSLLNLNADLQIKNGSFYTDAYPALNRFSDVNISTDLDTLTIRSLHMTSRNNSIDLTGNVPGLRNFLIATSAAPLRINLDAHLANADINTISGTYYDGVAKTSGRPANYKVAPLHGFSSSDSVCVVIPRNILANISLSADKAKYMDYDFAPLSTGITLRDGDASLSHLSIGSGFCNARIDWTYSTADLHDIRMILHLDVDSLDAENIIHTFPMLVSNVPELEGMKGRFSISADGNFLMWPDMFVNAPSMQGEATFTADGVSLERKGKLARISHFMLMRGDQPLEIDNFSIHGSIHDNLMMLDPFTIDCGPYSLLVGGVNNLRGRIYYHAGLKHSPFHIPFGVNLEGYYRKPKIRLGGADIHDGQELRISSELSDSVNVNIMQQLHHGWLLFVNQAAKYDATHRQLLSDL